MKISADQIRRVELKSSSDASEAIWRQLEEREVAGDVLLVTKREGANLDYLSGVVGNVSSDEVAFDWDGQKVGIKRTKVSAIAYFHAKPAQLQEAAFSLLGLNPVRVQKMKSPAANLPNPINPLRPSQMKTSA